MRSGLSSAYALPEVMCGYALTGYLKDRKQRLGHLRLKKETPEMPFVLPEDLDCFALCGSIVISLSILFTKSLELLQYRFDFARIFGGDNFQIIL